MTIEEVKAKKDNLEKAVSDLVKSFEEEVKLPVRVIHVDCTMFDRGDKLVPWYHAKAEVHL